MITWKLKIIKRNGKNKHVNLSYKFTQNCENFTYLHGAWSLYIVQETKEYPPCKMQSSKVFYLQIQLAYLRYLPTLPLQIINLYFFPEKMKMFELLVVTITMCLPPYAIKGHLCMSQFLKRRALGIYRKPSSQVAPLGCNRIWSTWGLNFQPEYTLFFFCSTNCLFFVGILPEKRKVCVHLRAFLLPAYSFHA